MAISQIIRPAGPRDLQPLLELGRRTFIDTFAEHNDPEDFAVCLEEHYSLARFQRDMADRRTRFFVVESNSSLLAYARVRRGRVPVCVGDPTALEIEKFYVDQPHIGRGIGARLMTYCLRFAARHGHKTIFLSVWEHNARAIRFYEKWGYRKVGEHIFHVGSDPQIDWWLMRAVD